MRSNGGGQGYKIFIKDKNGDEVTLAELARRYNAKYSSLCGRYRDGERDIDKLVNTQRKAICVLVGGVKMSASKAAKVLKIRRTSVLSRWRLVQKGKMSQERFETVGPLEPMKKQKSKPTDEWILLGKNKKNGDGFDQSIKIRTIPLGTFERRW